RGKLRLVQYARGRSGRGEASRRSRRDQGVPEMRRDFSMQTKRAVVVVGVGLLLAAVPAMAHHAFSAEFDINKPFHIQGTLTRWEMINPHSWFHFDVKEPDGTVVSWMIEGGSPNQLIKAGVTKHTLAIGTELIIEGYQAKD